jgi:MoaA/NifB/PqqE/SkfB family radical SAM enzyme
MKCVAIRVGTACNNGCLFCALRGDAGDALGEVATLRRELDDAKLAGASGVVFCGGEPSLHPRLLDLTEHARGLGFASVVVQSNGRRLAYGQFTRALAAAGLTGVDLSLHGPAAPIHEYHTRVPGSFEQTLAGARRVAALGLVVGVTTVATRSNYRHLLEMAALASDLGAVALHVAMARPLGGAAAEVVRLIPRFAMVAPYLVAAAKQLRHVGRTLAVSGIPYCCLGEAAARVAEYAVVLPRDSFGAPSGSSACDGCALEQRCPQAPARYLEVYGAGELSRLDVAPPREGAQPTAQLFAGLGPPSGGDHG